MVDGSAGGGKRVLSAVNFYYFVCLLICWRVEGKGERRGGGNFCFYLSSYICCSLFLCLWKSE